MISSISTEWMLENVSAGDRGSEESAAMEKEKMMMMERKVHEENETKWN